MKDLIKSLRFPYVEFERPMGVKTEMPIGEYAFLPVEHVAYRSWWYDARRIGDTIQFLFQVQFVEAKSIFTRYAEEMQNERVVCTTRQLNMDRKDETAMTHGRGSDVPHTFRCAKAKAKPIACGTGRAVAKAVQPIRCRWQSMGYLVEARRTRSP